MGAADFLAPGETVGATISGGYQTVNRERLGTLTGYARPVDGLDFVGSVTKRDSGSIELGDGNELTNTDDNIIAGFAKAGFKFADHHLIEGLFISFNNDAEEPNNGQGAGESDSVDKEIRSNTFRAAYSYNNSADNLFDLDLVTYYTDFQADELRLDALGIGPIGELLKRDVNTTGVRLDNRSHLRFSDSIATTFTYGGEFYHDEQDGAAGSGARDGVPDADANFYGLFAQAEVTISEPFGVVPGDFLIIPGARYDDYKTSSSLAGNNNESEVSPRVGVSYLPTDWLMLFANYAQAFRAPTFNETFLTGTHFRIPTGAGVVNRFVPNPDLKPQKTRTVEFGGGLTFDDVVESRDQFQVKASHFRIRGDDFIDLSVNQPTLYAECNPNIPGNCDGTTNSDNVSNAKLWGNEVEASYASSRLLLALGFSMIDGKNDGTGAKLGGLTPDQFTVNTGLKMPEIDSIIGWRMLAADKFDDVNDPDDERDGYAVHDLYFTWRPSERPLKGLRVDLGVDNAFDKAYSRVFTGATEAGRSFKALVSYSHKW